MIRIMSSRLPTETEPGTMKPDGVFRQSLALCGILVCLSLANCCVAEAAGPTAEPPKGDIVDFIEARRADGLTNDQTRAEIESLADNTQPFKPRQKTAQLQAYQPFLVDVLPQPVRGFVSVSTRALGCDARRTEGVVHALRAGASRGCRAPTCRIASAGRTGRSPR